MASPGKTGRAARNLLNHSPRGLPDDAPPAERYAALRRDIAGLEEVCRWQWHLIQQLQQHLGRLPDAWPDPPPRP